MDAEGVRTSLTDEVMEDNVPASQDTLAPQFSASMSFEH